MVTPKIIKSIDAISYLSYPEEFCIDHKPRLASLKLLSPILTTQAKNILHQYKKSKIYMIKRFELYMGR
jgi:hypothetical protein